MGRQAIPEVRRRQLNAAVDRLAALLPEDWGIVIDRRTTDGGTVRFSRGDESAVVRVIARDRLEPRDLDSLEIPETAALVTARWLSPRTRELLRRRRCGFVDSTGNVEVRLSRPGLYLRVDGADRDPMPTPKQGPSLRGPRVWALLRTLVEVEPPYTAGDLAKSLTLDNGYVSRVLQVLADDRLIARRPRGPVTAVEWEPLLRRLIESYSLMVSNDTTTWIAAAGPTQLLQDLPKFQTGRWAVTGSFVASSLAPVAAPEVAILYTNDPERLARAARLLPSTTGANVILAKPYDPIVFERGIVVGNFPAVSIAQAAADTLTGPGRMPAEGEALLTWMRRNERRWRATSLQA